MDQALSNLDILVFFGSLLLIMLIGLWASSKETSAEGYFLAGSQTKWWGVAGSIFGSNVSANHIVGMLGVGYSIGFAQSHFEVGAVAGLLLLCYVFLPIYKKMKIYTLSEYLAFRYDERSRLIYAMIMIFIIVFVMMVPGFYIGSRSLNILISGNYEHVEFDNYVIGILAMALITGSYTIFGGLKAVILTDVFQSALLIFGIVIVAFVTFSQPEINGWSGMIELDKNGKQLMHMYLPSNHPELPWTGVFTGLYIMHFYYWGTNQFIVQRALSAKSIKEARVGIILAGIMKLVIPFLSIGTGVATYYLFQIKGMNVAQDAAFTTLMTEFIKPIGYGVLGLVAAGLIGAILSSLDSMMNSAATMITFDIYKRHIQRNASEEALILMGKIWIIILISGAALVTIFMMDPNSSGSFFLHVVKHQANLIPGVVVAFVLGLFWKRASSSGAFYGILTAIAVSYLFPLVYEAAAKAIPELSDYFGSQINFLHNVLISTLCSSMVHVMISLKTPVHESKSKYTLIGLNVFTLKSLRVMMLQLVLTLGIFFVLAVLMVFEILSPFSAGILAATIVFFNFVSHSIKGEGEFRLKSLLLCDKVFSGLLAAVAVFIMFYFY